MVVVGVGVDNLVYNVEVVCYMCTVQEYNGKGMDI